MTETDSIRLARMEEKLDAWMDKADERHKNTCKDIGVLQTDVSSLKEGRAKIIGAAIVLSGIMGAIGGKALNLLGFTSGK